MELSPDAKNLMPNQIPSFNVTTSVKKSIIFLRLDRLRELADKLDLVSLA
jgi:hypothetical protein